MMNRGAWTAQEDKILKEYIQVHGEGQWKKVSQKTDLRRNGKSCRLRWLNYLRPDIKRGNISADEEELIIRLHKLLGNRWSLIAGRLPGRTDNEIKNYWRTHLGKKLGLQSSSSASKAKNQRPLKADSNVIRTKPVKCCRVFINPQPMKPGNSDEEARQGRLDVDSDPFLMSNITNDAGPTFASQENDQSDFLLDFNMVDFCLLDHLDFEFSESCKFSYSAIDHNDNVLASSESTHTSSEVMAGWDPLKP